MRYYSTQRPVSPGSYPTGGVISIVNFDTKRYVSEIGGNAWGYIEYGIELPVEDANWFLQTVCMFSFCNLLSGR